MIPDKSFPAYTPKLVELSMKCPYFIDELRAAKLRGNLTDFGLIECIRVAKSTGLSLRTIAERMNRDRQINIEGGTIPRKGNKFLGAQIEYHGSPI